MINQAQRNLAHIQEREDHDFEWSILYGRAHLLILPGQRVRTQERGESSDPLKAIVINIREKEMKEEGDWIH